MSRSNPTDTTPNPATRFMEWGGQAGSLHYYDKEDKKRVDIPLPFTFLLLDQLATVKGWHDLSESGIYSNEVRDTRADPMIVKAFKGGTIAEGIYKDNRDKIAAAGGHFVSSLYIAFKEGELKLGNLSFKGAALREWMEFSNNNKADLYNKAIVIDGFKEGKKGSVVFKTPTFRLKEITPETDAEARKVDEVLQSYLKGYFKRTKVEQADEPSHEHTGGTYHTQEGPTPDGPASFDDDSIPFAPNYL